MHKPRAGIHAQLVQYAHGLYSTREPRAGSAPASCSARRLVRDPCAACAGSTRSSCSTRAARVGSVRGSRGARARLVRDPCAARAVRAGSCETHARSTWRTLDSFAHATMRAMSQCGAFPAGSNRSVSLSEQARKILSPRDTRGSIMPKSPAFVVFSHFTALQIHSSLSAEPRQVKSKSPSPLGKRASLEPARIRKASTKSVSAREIREACQLVSNICGMPLGNAVHIITAAQSQHRNVEFANLHLCTVDLPAGSVFKLARNVFVCSPELALLQIAASGISRIALLELAYETCGTYRRALCDGGAVFNVAPFCAKERIGAFARKHPSLRGSKIISKLLPAAHTAARFATEAPSSTSRRSARKNGSARSHVSTPLCAVAKSSRNCFPILQTNPPPRRRRSWRCCSASRFASEATVSKRPS